MNKKSTGIAAALLALIMFMVNTGSASANSNDFEAAYQHNLAVYNDQQADKLEFYKLPEYSIQSNDPEIVSLANFIISGSSGDYAKARAIHDWVASNIYYDVDLGSVSAGPVHEGKSALDVLNSKRGICDGYTNLTIALLRAVGIPAKKVMGFVAMQ